MTSQADPRAPRVVLVGPPGAGKSTIGRKLARELGVQLYDTDAGIEEQTGRTIADIFATDGEAEFRKIEEQVVRRAVLDEPGVVSLGGGAVLSENTRALLREHTVVYLEISVAEGLRRTGTSNARPLLNGADPGAKYRELMRRRRPLYREVATVRVRTDGRSPGRVVKMIMGKLSLESVRPAAGEAGEQQNRPRSTNPQGSSRSRARRRSRARAAARRAAQAAANGQTGSTEQNAKTTAQTTKTTGQSGAAAGQHAATAGSSSTGRSRRARARRARARARTQQERTESEQST
ncbi:shikimate kinase [Nocardia cyriacigeorgica]|uniref:Shikimate kinase n=2 Tax=Nocardia cyriacigeorgica TaxID=135487 RepID=H6R1B6_NOCCG|nr:shikimate kinase [Nocardia cyriacigeorgica]CCF64296.1 Shikimate kinase (SK) (modular protein) [Nocardia cyriacigeorgica GUH-2]MBF6284599.1 shikimate kinase [Nocardia cyriacigeorgica]MBF6423552.1 shikimate kinase [Nocardia cyriacigeorgica]NEW33910.1 shikimate kinase [Nocardia cyriacigeorgica]